MASFVVGKEREVKVGTSDHRVIGFSEIPTLSEAEGEGTL
jgi:hypothetical protein